MLLSPLTLAKPRSTLNSSTPANDSVRATLQPGRTEARADTTTLDAQLEYLAGLRARITAVPDTTAPLEARRRRNVIHLLAGDSSPQ